MSQAPDPPTRPRRPVLRFLGKRLRGWLARHRHPFNLGVHLVGIPLALTGLVLLFVPGVAWYWGAGGLLLGYLLQYVGHRVEGNDVGEWAALKRLFGLPYVAISPRWEAEERV